MRVTSENVSQKTIASRMRVRKYRMRKKLMENRQKLIRDRLQANDNLKSSEDTATHSEAQEKKIRLQMN